MDDKQYRELVEAIISDTEGYILDRYTADQLTWLFIMGLMETWDFSE